jgi:predicted phage tail protein
MSAHDIDYIKTTLVYDPLDIDNRVEVELQYVEGMPLSKYIDGLPDDVEWGVALNNRHVPLSGAMLVMPKPGDHLIVTPVPRGGGGDGKNVLAIVATIALAAFAPWAGGKLATSLLGFKGAAAELAGTIIGSAISVAGGLLINALLPPPEQSTEETQESFGIDGAKNTSAEGIPVPVLFGEHGFGGNIVDLYTENFTDDEGNDTQHLYGRIVVSEGPIEEIDESQIYINDQLASSYDEIEFEKRLGSDNQAPSQWFDDTVSLYNQARDFTENWQTYTTTTQVDKLRVDLVFPLGLYRINREGETKSYSVDVEMEYRKSGSATWLPFFKEPVWGPKQAGDAHRVTFTYSPKMQWDDDDYDVVSPTPNFDLEYRVNGGAWTVHKTFSGGAYFKGYTGTETLQGFSNDVVDFRLVDNAGGFAFQAGTFTIDKVESQFQNNLITFDEKKRTPVRRTFTTNKLEQDVYEIRYRRTEPEFEKDNRYFNKLQLADVGEIITDDVGLINTAWLGFKVKLTGQLNGIPQVQGVAKGMRLPQFDHNGQFVTSAWTKNPADIALAMEIDRRWGGKLDDLTQIDWPAYSEWRDFCTDNGFTFDALYSELASLDDALKHVYLAGRAQRVRVGARISVAMDAPGEPEQMFNSALIEKGSLEISYLPFADRANDIAITYYDKDDRYRQKTVRAVNDAAIQSGEPLKTASINMKGLTSRSRVQREANFRINYNQHVVRNATWVAPLRSLTCSVGSIVLLQSEMVDWGVGGMLAAGSTSTTVQLDRPVEMQQGKTYSIIVHRDTRKYADTTISSVGSSNFVTVSMVLPNNRTINRLVVGGNDVGINRVIPGVTSTDLVLEQNSGVSFSAGMAVEIWSTDVIDQVDVTNSAVGTQEFTELNLQSPLTDGAPPQFTAFLFGEKAVITRPFRITDIERDEETKAKISAIEYVEDVYNDIDTNSGNLSGAFPELQHVQNLLVEETSILNQSGSRDRGIQIAWNRVANGAHVGALVQYKFDTGSWIDLGEYTEDFAEMIIPADVGVVTVRVVAKGRTGFMGLATAPTQTITMTGYVETLPAPLDWTATPGFRSITFNEPVIADRTVEPYDLQTISSDSNFGHYEIWEAALGDVFANATKLVEFTGSKCTVQTPINTVEKSYFIVLVDHIGNISDPSIAINAAPESPRTVSLSTAAQSFTYDGSGLSPNPATATITATAQSILSGETPYYEFTVDGTSVQNTVSNTYNYTPDASLSNMPQRIMVRLRIGSASGEVLDTDELTLIGLQDGSSALSMLLSNESHTVPANNDGTGADLTGAVTNVTVFSGATDVTNDWVLSISAVAVGTSATIIGNVVTVGGLTSDKGWVDIQATRIGFPTLTKRMSLSQSRVGVKGDKGDQGDPGRSITDVSKTGQTVTVTYNSGPSDTFTVKGISSANKVGDTLTITYDDGSTSTITDGDAGVGISNITRSGDTVTITYDDASTSTYTVTDGKSAVIGYIDWITPSNIEKASDGTYSGNNVEFDAVFTLDGTVVARERHRINRLGDAWSNFTTVSEATNLNTVRLSHTQDGASFVKSGVNVVATVSYNWAGQLTTVSASASIVMQGLGIATVDKTGSTVTVTYDNGNTDTFTVNGVSNASKVGGTLTITYDDGTTQVIEDGDPGVGIASIVRTGDTVTITYDDTTTSTYTVTDGVDAIYGDVDPVSVLTVTKDALGVYSANELDFDFEFRQGTTIIAADRFRITRSGDTWSATAGTPTGGPSVDTASLTPSIVVNGQSARLTITHSSGSKATAPVTLVIDGATGDKGDKGDKGDIGDTGATGDTVATGYVYFQTLQTPAPGIPSGSAFNTSTSEFGTLTTGWGYTPPEVDATDTSKRLWQSRYTVVINGVTSAQTINFSTPTGAIVFTDDIRSDNYNGSGDGVTPGTAGWIIKRNTGFAEFGSASIRGKLAVSQLSIDETVFFDTDGSGNLIIKAAGIDTGELKLNAANIPVYGETASAVSGDASATWKTLLTLNITLDTTADVLFLWGIRNGFSSPFPTFWGYEFLRGATQLAIRPGMTNLDDQPSGMLMDENVAAGTHTYTMKWRADTATTTGLGFLTLLGIKR